MRARCSPTGEYIACAGTTSELRLWRADNQESVWSGPPLMSHAPAMAFSPDGNTLVAAGWITGGACVATLRDVRTGLTTGRFRIGNETIAAMQFIGRSELCICTEDGSLYRWPLNRPQDATRYRLGVPENAIKQHQSPEQKDAKIAKRCRKRARVDLPNRLLPS
jgi:hypothetical protein